MKCGHVGQVKSVSRDAQLRLESPQCRVATEIILLDEDFEEGSPDVGPPTPEKVYKRKRSPTLPEISNCLLLTEGHEDTLENGTHFVLHMFIKPFFAKFFDGHLLLFAISVTEVVHASCCGNCKNVW